MTWWISLLTTYYQRELIFINTKNQRNSEIYERVPNEMKKRADERGTTFTFNVF